MNKNQLDSLRKEKEVFSLVRGEYVVKAVWTFIHKNNICFVMEYMHGGDLGNLIK